MAGSQSGVSSILFGLAVLLLLHGVVANDRECVSPTFLWGPGTHILSSTSAVSSQVSYQTIPPQQLVNDVLRSIIAAQDGKSRTLLVFLGSQLNVAELPQLSVGSLQPLQHMLSRTAASIVLPFARPTAEQNLYSALLSELQVVDGVTVVDYCKDVSDIDIAAIRAPESSKQQVIVVCPADSADLGSQMALLSKAVEAVEATGGEYLALYTSKTATKVDRRRYLQEEIIADEDQDYVCDDTCKAQVRTFEALILAVIILVALLAGTWLMGAVPTPTRFEAPKKEVGGLHE